MTTPSFSRLGSSNAYDITRSNLLARQTNLANLQDQMTSGKRVVVASDDPTSAAQAERSLTRITRIAADLRALESQRSAISTAEGALGEASEALQTIRERVFASGNAAYSTEQRKSIAFELSGLRNQLFEIANRKDASGLPIFGGLGSALAPFTGPTAPPQDYTFNGLPGQTANSDVGIPLALDGDSGFMHKAARDGVYNVKVSNTVTGTIPSDRTLTTTSVSLTNSSLVNGSAYSINVTGVSTTAGITTVTYGVTETPNVGGPYTGLTVSYPSTQTGIIPVTVMPGIALTITGTPAVGDTIKVDPSASIFSVLDNAIKDIGGAVNGNDVTQAVGQALNNIDIGMARISAIRGQAGDFLNRADRISSNQGKRSIDLEADRSRVEDLDMIKGISEFQKQQTGYQAALQTYAQVQKLSLFNFIS